MIWRSAVNILWALVRNTLQGNHQCILLEKADGWGWTWECSCGSWGVFEPTEASAIEGFQEHCSRKKVSA